MESNLGFTPSFRHRCLEEQNLTVQQLKVAVVGAGGTGAYYGGALAKAGHDVTFIARGPHLDAISKHGLQLNTVLLGDFHLDSPATDDMSSIGPVDLAIFAVKSWGTQTAIADMAGVVGKNTLIISTQNGIDSERLLSDAFGKEHVLGCTATVSSMITSPGVVTQAGGPGSLVIGALSDGQTARMKEFVTQCVEAGIAAESHENIELAIWEKFTFICALSGMTALTRKPIGDIFAQESTTRMYLQVLTEVAEVGRATGIPLPESIAADLLATTQAREPFIIGSMGHDLITNNPIEISLLNARVVELGKQHGVETPANFAIEAALRPYEFGED